MTDRFNPRALDAIAYKNGIRSDTKLAAHLGVNRSTLNRWRSGDSQPNFVVIAKMITNEKIPAEDLLIREDVAEAA